MKKCAMTSNVRNGVRGSAISDHPVAHCIATKCLLVDTYFGADFFKQAQRFDLLLQTCGSRSKRCACLKKSAPK